MKMYGRMKEGVHGPSSSELLKSIPDQMKKRGKEPLRVKLFYMSSSEQNDLKSELEKQGFVVTSDKSTLSIHNADSAEDSIKADRNTTLYRILNKTFLDDKLSTSDRDRAVTQLIFIIRNIETNGKFSPAAVKLSEVFMSKLKKIDG